MSEEEIQELRDNADKLTNFVKLSEKKHKKV